ncbi:MAG: hypothetical protein N4A72_22875 [Bacteroidales bacterium]|jgi:hypothetical protein|nr:hypothetical protein [Bacteroidales bacterium]
MNEKQNSLSKSTPKTTQERILTVINKPYKDKYTNGINIQGEYLKEFGFELGDKVSVEISRNKILIKKLIEKE